jgi:hypothetical protein
MDEDKDYEEKDYTVSFYFWGIEGRMVVPWKFLPRRTEIEGDLAWRELWANSVRPGQSNRNS